MTHIFITGASSGIGAALALHYAQAGVHLTLTGRDAERLSKVAQQAQYKGASVATHVVSVTDKPQMTHIIEAADQTRPITLMVANAGVGGGGAQEPTGPSLSTAEDMFDININGVVNTVHPVIPLMAARKSGQIAILGSLAAYRGLAGAPAYAASKGFAKLYGEGLRGALAPHGVRVSVICPGFVESGITARNTFPMPFFMAADKAAGIIAAGLARNRGRIAFPWPMALAAWALGALPFAVSEGLVRLLPPKNP